MKDDEFRNITVSRLELYSLIDALESSLKKMYDVEEDHKEYDYYANRIKYEERLLKRLEVTLGE